MRLTSDQVRQIRELRNEIAHEYQLEELKELFSAVLGHSEQLTASADTAPAI